MKILRAILKWSLAILLGIFIGISISQMFTEMTKTGVWSNRWAVERDLNQGIEAYHKTYGHYPDSLDVIDIPWLANESDRRKLLLKPFYYENRGSTYILWWPRTER